MSLSRAKEHLQKYGLENRIKEEYKWKMKKV